MGFADKQYYEVHESGKGSSERRSVTLRIEPGLYASMVRAATAHRQTYREYVEQAIRERLKHDGKPS